MSAFEYKPLRVHSKVWQASGKQYTGRPPLPEEDPVKVFPDLRALEAADHGDDYLDMGHLSGRRVGICFSGGGYRSAALSAGAMRGFRELGHDVDIKYISCVSGGSWFSVPYTFLNHDDYPDLEYEQVEEYFLGRYGSRPENLTLEDLGRDFAKKAKTSGDDSGEGSDDTGDVKKPPLFSDVISPTSSWALNMVTVKTSLRLYWAQFWFNRYKKKDVPDQYISARAYADALGHNILKPYGIGDERLVAQSTAHVDEILGRHDYGGALESDDFVTPAEDRPFLIAGAALLADYSRLQSSEIHFEMTPLHTGCRTLQPAVSIGGGFVETFAYDSQSPTFIETEEGEDIEGYTDPEINVGAPFRIADIMGSSGSAPEQAMKAMRAEKFKGSDPCKDGIFPVFPHWPPGLLRPKLDQPDNNRGHGDEAFPLRDTARAHCDGGVQENFGIMPLIARGVEKIVCFVNTPCALPEMEPTGAFNVDACDSSLRELFVPVKGDSQNLNQETDADVVFSHGRVWVKTAYSRRSDSYSFTKSAKASKVLHGADLLEAVVRELLQSKLAGGPATVRCDLTCDFDLPAGSTFGLSAAEAPDGSRVRTIDIEVVFVYNEKCSTFAAELAANPDREVRVAIEESLKPKPDADQSLTSTVSRIRKSTRIDLVLDAAHSVYKYLTKRKITGDDIEEAAANAEFPLFDTFKHLVQTPAESALLTHIMHWTVLNSVDINHIFST